MTIEAAAERVAGDAGDPPIRSTYRPAEPVDLLATLGVLSRGGDGPCLVRSGGGVWLTQRRRSGAATLRLDRVGDGVEAVAWGPGAEEAIAGVPALLGAADDWSGLDLSGVPALAEIRRRRPGLRLAAAGTVPELLVVSVLEQQVTCVEAWRAWRWLVRRAGEPAPGPAPAGMAVAPDLAGWRAVPSWTWHRAGVDPRRSAIVNRVAHLGATIEALGALPAAEAERRLRSIPGIGPWTAAEVTLRSHGHPDAVSVGDYHLAGIVGTALAGCVVDDDGMLELLAPWAGQRQRVLRLIGLSGTRPERRGPRARMRDHAGR